jgi:hypothetical protein
MQMTVNRIFTIDRESYPAIFDHAAKGLLVSIAAHAPRAGKAARPELKAKIPAEVRIGKLPRPFSSCIFARCSGCWTVIT